MFGSSRCLYSVDSYFQQYHSCILSLGVEFATADSDNESSRHVEINTFLSERILPVTYIRQLKSVPVTNLD